MNPRLSPAPLTREDGEIWAGVVNRSGRCFSSYDAGLYHRVTLGADRRDADLMYTHARCRSLFGSRAVDVLQSLFSCGDCHKWMWGWETESGFKCGCKFA